MNAPLPTLISRTSAEVPLATFLAMMLAAIRPSFSIVAVTSRKAYSTRSAGTSRSLWLTTATPMRSSWRRNSPCGSCTRKPGMDSSLSSVPPVWPSPRPDIFPNTAPHAATKGASTSVTLSPTPPLECLSSTGRRSTLRSSVFPLSTSARASSRVSVSLRPRRTIAMSSALAWYEGTAPLTLPSTKARMRAPSSSLPSRFQAITSLAKSTGLLPPDLRRVPASAPAERPAGRRRGWWRGGRQRRARPRASLPRLPD